MEPWRLAFRVAVALFVIATPTVLFVLLWRGLMRLRDDVLVRRIEEHMDEPAAPAFGERSPSPAGGGSSPGPLRPSPAEGATVVSCDRCGGENHPGFDYCRECLAPLPDD